MPPEVTIIIPVFNGAHLIGNTIESLQQQSFKNFEVIIVDDCSTDGSFDVIGKYQERDSRLVCLKTDKNLGIVPKVMNFAQKYVQGRYFMYSSQDDHFSQDMLEKLVRRAHSTDADATLPDVEFYFPNVSERRQIVGCRGDHDAIVDGSAAFLLSLDWTISGNALWKAKFLHEPGYSDFGMYADEYTARLFFLNCKKVAFCDGVFFYNQGNPNAITKKVSPIRLDRPYNDYMIYRLIIDAAPNSEWRLKYSKIAAMALIQAFLMVEKFPDLHSHKDRLRPAIQAMRSAEFQNDFNRALMSTPLVKRIIIKAAIRSTLVLKTFSMLRVRLDALKN